MTVQLTSLRVAADFDSSKYVAGLAQKDAAEARSAASSKRVEVSVLSAKSRLDEMGGGVTRLARQTIAGFQDVERFSKGVLNVSRALETGQFSADQAAASLDGLYRKYGLVANATELAEAGHVQLAQAVTAANAKLALTETAADGAAVAQTRLAATSKMLAFQQRNLLFQLNDVAVSLAGGMNPLTVFAQQGSQIATIWGPDEGGVGRAFRETGKMVTGVIGRFPVLTGLTVAGAAAWAGMTYEINQASDVTVGFGDVALATFQVIRDGVLGILQPAFTAIAPYVETAWNGIVSATKVVGNTIINAFRAAAADVGFVFDQLPNILGAATIGAANAVIGGLNTMFERATGLLNSFISQVNSVLAALPFGAGEGLVIGEVGKVAIPKIDNTYSTDLAKANAEHEKRQRGILGSDPLGGFFDAVKVQAVANALDDVKEKAGTAGGALRKAANDNRDPWAGLTDGLKEAAGFLREITGGIIDDLKSGLQEGKSLWQAFGTAATNALTKITDTLLNEVLDALFQVNGAGGAGGGGGILGTLIGGLLGGGGDPWAGMRTVTANANGNAISSGNVIPFARGGVVTRPTLFPMASGAGLMGEAGPEAVMPLRRLPSGRLGVEAGSAGSAAQGGPLVNVQVINNASNTRVREDRRAGPDGREMRRIIIEEVKGEMASGGFDGVMTGRYGASPQRVAR
jgi:lambda family phage tail tape measure protein